MSTLEVLLMGPDTQARSELADTIRGLGHGVTEAGPRKQPPVEGDVVLVDLRDVDWSALHELADDGRPAVLLASEPRRAIATLGSRRGGLMLMSREADERALRVALNVCSGLGGLSEAGPTAAVG
jgi:hypothetical protein